MATEDTRKVMADFISASKDTELSAYANFMEQYANGKEENLNLELPRMEIPEVPKNLHIMSLIFWNLILLYQ